MAVLLRYVYVICIRYNDGCIVALCVCNLYITMAVLLRYVYVICIPYNDGCIVALCVCNLYTV